MDYFLQQFINGVQLGTVYALIALGYTMVYGIIKLINFAHADIFMIGVYTAYFTATWHRMPLGLVIIISMLVCAIIGISMEKLAYKPLRYKPRLSALITALGVSLFLENFCSLPFVFGPEYRNFPEIIEVKRYILWKKYDIVVTNVFMFGS